MIRVPSGKTEQRVVKGAQVILSASGGMTLKEISARSGLIWQNCLWEAFMADRSFRVVEGMGDVHLLRVRETQNCLPRWELFICSKNDSNIWSF